MLKRSIADFPVVLKTKGNVFNKNKCNYTSKNTTYCTYRVNVNVFWIHYMCVDSSNEQDVTYKFN